MKKFDIASELSKHVKIPAKIASKTDYNDLDINIVVIAQELESKGFLKEAIDLKERYVEYKKAERALDGDKLLDQAHPKPTKIEGLDVQVKPIQDLKKDIMKLVGIKTAGKETPAILNDAHPKSTDVKGTDGEALTVQDAKERIMKLLNTKPTGKYAQLAARILKSGRGISTAIPWDDIDESSKKTVYVTLTFCLANNHYCIISDYFDWTWLSSGSPPHPIEPGYKDLIELLDNSIEAMGEKKYLINNTSLFNESKQFSIKIPVDAYKTKDGGNILLDDVYQLHFGAAKQSEIEQYKNLELKQQKQQKQQQQQEEVPSDSVYDIVITNGVPTSSTDPKINDWIQNKQILQATNGKTWFHWGDDAKTWYLWWDENGRYKGKDRS